MNDSIEPDGFRNGGSPLPSRAPSLVPTASRIFSGLLTDLDNTLYDFAAAQEAACLAAVRIAGAGDCEGLIRAFLFSPQGVANTDPIRIYLMQQGVCDDSRIAAACMAYEAAKKEAIIPFPGVPETLRKIHACGITIGAVTNAHYNQARERLELIGVSDLFTSLVCPDVSGCKKPDPVIYIRAAEEIGVAASRICVIGDNLVNDIGPARSLGMFTVHAKYGDRLGPEFSGGIVPDQVLYSFSGLVEVLGIDLSCLILND